MRRTTAGRIRYEITFIRNPAYQGGRADLFSGALLSRIRRQNVPEWRVVTFDGERSRSEEINVDYGVRSLSVRLRNVDQRATTYCKAFRTFGFCVEQPTQVPMNGPPPDFALTNETATIAGLHCRKGQYQGARHLHIWFTDEIDVEDRTGAVLRMEGVPGLIMQTEEIAASGIDEVERVTVAELSFEAPPSGIFAVPAGFETFDDIDAARAEERRNLDAQSADALRRHPLAAGERDMFVGKWLFDSPDDRILVDIARAGEGKFRVRTTVLTAPADAAGRVREESATMQGRALLVEDPPNYRLYNLADRGRTLVQVDNALFSFVRR